MLRSLPERQALNYAAARPRGLHLILSLASVTPAAVPEAVDGLIESRALVLDEIAARRDVGRDGEAAADAARTAMTSAQQRLANLLVRGPGSMSPTQYASLVDTARQESEAAEQALAERSARLQGRTQSGPDRRRAGTGRTACGQRAGVDCALRPHGARCRRPVDAAGRPSARAPARVVPSYIAFVLRPGQPPAAVPLGSVQAIDTLVVTVAHRHRRRDEPVASTSEEGARSSRASGLALRRRVWDRVAEHLGDARRVFIVPDGSLSLVPFAALPVGQRRTCSNAARSSTTCPRSATSCPRRSGRQQRAACSQLVAPSFDDRSVFRGRARPTSHR